MCGVFFSLHFSLVSVVVLTCNELHFIRTKTSVIVCVSHFEQFTTASKSSRHASDVFFPNFSLVCCCFVFSVALVFSFVRSYFVWFYLCIHFGSVRFLWSTQHCFQYSTRCARILWESLSYILHLLCGDPTHQSHLNESIARTYIYRSNRVLTVEMRRKKFMKYI